MSEKLNTNTSNCSDKTKINQDEVNQLVLDFVL